MGKAQRKNCAKPRGGLEKTEKYLSFSPPAVFRSLAFLLPGRSFCSSSLTESLVQATQKEEKRIIKSSYQYSLTRVKSNHKTRQGPNRKSTVQLNRSTVMGR